MIKASITGDFEQHDNDIEKMDRAMQHLPQAMDKGAKLIRDSARSIAINKGLQVTGKGVEGIVVEPENDDRLIGWTRRPYFHLYFHEIGTYKDAPRPHMRPAAEREGDRATEIIQRMTITGIKF